jgi:hypothetical protein
MEYKQISFRFIVVVGLLCLLWWLVYVSRNSFESTTTGLPSYPRPAQRLFCEAHKPALDVPPCREIWRSDQDQFDLFHERHPDFDPVIYDYAKRHVFWAWQGQHAWRMLRNNIPLYNVTQLETNLSRYAHEFLPSLAHTHCGFTLSIIVHEKRDGAWTAGGSGFKITAHHVYTASQYLIDLCPVVDYFNGTYLIQCQVKADILDVAILLNFVEFNAFQGLSTHLDTTVYRKRFARQDYTDWPVSKQVPGKAGWHVDSNTANHISLRYVSARTGITYPLPDSRVLCDVLRNRTVITIGASHMNLMGTILGKFFCPGVNVRRYHLRYIREFSQRVGDILHANANGSTTFLLQTGIWDLAMGPQSERKTDTEGLDRFAEVLRRFLDHAVSTPSVRIIVVGTPARRDESYKYLDNANNHNVAVFNRLFGQKVAEVNRQYPASAQLAYFDMFEVSRAVAHTAVHHILHFANCDENDKPVVNCTGDSGLILTQLAAYDVLQPIV